MRSKLFNFIVVLYSVFLVFTYEHCLGQYGLEFSSHENELDKRTSLTIGEKKSIKLTDKTEIAFDLQFKPYQKDYFGYIFRLVLDDQVNVDLLYDRRLDNGKHFKLVVGDKFTDINFDIPSSILFYQWSPIKLVLDKKKGTIELLLENSRFSQKIDLGKHSQYKLFFGFNDYHAFQSSDLPPMRIKDLQILNNDKVCDYWKLDEITGDIANPSKGSIKGVVRNPLWIQRQRQEWNLDNEFYVSGQASAAFDGDRECVYIVSEDSLVRTFLGAKVRKSWKYKEAPLHMVNGSQSIVDPFTQRVLNISIDQKTVSTFDTLTGNWSHSFKFPAHGTHYLSFNKYFDKRDTSIYMIAGYGHFRYKNTVHKYHVPSQTWDSLSFAGDTLFPHYLGALGVGKDGVFLLGGYGSSTGDQMLNPQVSNDFVQMDAESKTFKKLFDFDFPIQESVWANSLVIDDQTNSLFGLMFPRNKFKSSLQLVAIAKDGSSFQELGSSIPFDFHDIKSFADLYYSKASNRFIAVTLFYDSSLSQSRVRIYSLLAPSQPYVLSEGTGQASNLRWLWYSLAVVILGFIGLLLWKRKAKKSNGKIHPSGIPHVPVLEPIQSLSSNAHTQNPEPKSSVSSIFLFRGDIQIFNKQGLEITKQFSPLLKELLTMFMVYSIYRGRGISSEKLTELFWSDKSVSSATNNRSVNIAKINALLEQVGDVKISKQSGYWKLENHDQIHIDFSEFMYLLKNADSMGREDTNRLLAILDNGAFMFDTDYEWLDGIKDEVSIHTISLLSNMLVKLNLEKDAEVIVEIANRIFHFDSVNEEAMVFKCKALVHMGYHSLAHQCFENFSQIYKQLYAESFSKSYREIV